TTNGVRLIHAGGNWTFPAASGMAVQHVVVRNGAITALGPAGVPAQLGLQYVNSSGYFAAVPIGSPGQYVKVNAGGNGYDYGAGGSFTPPTGTGVVTVTGGALDAASTGTTGSGNFARATS